MAVQAGIAAALDADRRHVWHPFTQMSAYHGHERLIERARGNYLFDSDGRAVFDAASSIWVTVHGHCHPAIADAIAAQARLLDHATLLGQSNPPSALLAARLAALLPASLSKTFYASDGASAVEAALKIAVQYWHNRGEQRALFVAHERGYHGDTTGAMSVSGVADFLRPFAGLRFPSVQLAWSPAYLDELEHTLLARGHEVAAVAIEPLVQMAGGVKLMPSASLTRAAELCRAHGVLLIVDEIATGFGRTGSMFAFEQAQIVPDIVCLGKSLTGGTLALSATVVSDDVFDAFLGEPRAARHFFHGHSYAGNPIACAAAMANLDLFTTEGSLDHVRAALPQWYESLDALRRHPRVADVRRLGFIAGVELRDGLDAASAAPTRAWALCDALWERGVFVRPVGATLLLVPPLSSTGEELGGLVSAVSEALDG
jgi:adenosylmethionine-8-amino-7-oxononanoate transaminase